jgi:hypothetical protein
MMWIILPTSNSELFYTIKIHLIPLFPNGKRGIVIEKNANINHSIKYKDPFMLIFTNIHYNIIKKLNLNISRKFIFY